MLKIYSLIPSLKDEIGHFYEYNKAFTLASSLNHWKCIKNIPRNCSLNNLGNDWNKVLYGMEKGAKLKNFFPFYKIIKKLKKDGNAVLFLEDFTIVILFLIFICIFILRPKMKLWVLFRFEKDVMVFQGRLSLLLMRILEFLLGKNNIEYLTDSELIAQRNSKFFNRKFIVLPIPHTYMSQKKEIKNRKDKYYWWPGGLIRKERGYDFIKKIAAIFKFSCEAKLVLAEAAQKDLKNLDNILFLPTSLPRADYEYWMKKADLILLPYDNKLYAYRTSGMFVEAIMANNIPVVNDHTWMAAELRKYDLKELIINWDNSDLLKIFANICNSKKIKMKIRHMKSEYEKFHSVESLANVLKSIAL